ncbi:MAG TPA: hypothetical protein PLV06_06145 [Bacteroidales bacterium]|nr:hypothetical protein [Bacteroidales bacterium]HPJ58799.1 hypothetical protein [Bacteroidales bacterium]HPR11949.1 hypothetical protein [Bacteroidales bacterium]HRW85759.1 hypothetical protein [Bacteroidales bacterium]
MYPTNIAELSSNEWSKDFLRHPHAITQIDYDPNYLLNQAESINFFYSWFLNGNPGSYVAILKKQHLYASLGKNQDRKYRIKCYKKTKAETWFERESFPGRLRFELKKSGIPHPAVDMLRIKECDHYVIEKENYYKTFIEYSQMVHITDKRYKTPIFYRELENLSGTKIHILKYYRNGYFKIEHPQDDELIEYQNITQNLMAVIRNSIYSSTEDLLIDQLAKYYHNAIHWMPFAHINNSLFMGQINCILRFRGYSSVPHSDLDTYAQLTSTNNFVGIFKNYILKHQADKTYQ